MSNPLAWNFSSRRNGSGIGEAQGQADAAAYPANFAIQGSGSGGAINILEEVNSYLSGKRAQLNTWFFHARLALAIGFGGYLLADCVTTGRLAYFPAILLLTFGLANIYLGLSASVSAELLRWGFAGLDLGLILALRWMYALDILGDPNLTAAVLFALIVGAYVAYSDPYVCLALASAAVLSVAVMLGAPGAQAQETYFSYAAYPVVSLSILLLLAAHGILSTLLAQYLLRQVIGYAVELHKRAQATLTSAIERARREKLEELNNLKRDFIEVLSHELRTPITPLRSSLSIMQSEMQGDEASTEILAIAMEAADKLHRLVKDYTRLAELLTLETETVRRRNMRIDGLMSLLLEISPQSRLAIHGVQHLSVYADPRLLAGAVLALVRRAELRAGEESDDPLIITGREQNNEVILEIHDAGDSYDQTPLSFEDLFALSSERRYSSPNTGLEVTLAQYSLRRTDGYMHVGSNADNGTVFSCHIPRARPDGQWLLNGALRSELAHFLID